MSTRRGGRKFGTHGSIRSEDLQRDRARRWRLRPLAGAVLAAFWSPAVFAQPASSTGSAQSVETLQLAQASPNTPLQLAEANLREVNVTATRTPTEADRTPASISVITDQDLEEQQAQDIKEALRYEPGVT
ncbi:MAG: TonB-dependent receptor plug domain-containing protein, partial [Pandoraea sp.]|nr:TonB-dependent receptor plug domain-containing protein [Pandoraea sp.]